MTIAKEAVYALHQRLKDLSVNAPADQLAYLAKALESIAGHSTVYDIVNMSDEKLQEKKEENDDNGQQRAEENGAEPAQGGQVRC